MIKLGNIKYSVNRTNGGNKQHTILSDISLEIIRGEIFGVSGESGSGKTTLAKIIAGSVKPDSGKIVYSEGKRIKTVILFQNTGELINPFRKAGAQIDDMKQVYKGENSFWQEKESVLDLLGIDASMLGRRGSHLSGGERQRVALARLLLSQPDLLILDEPFSSQDPTAREHMKNLLAKIHSKYGLTIFCITHNVTLLKSFADRIMVLRNGREVETNSAEKLFAEPKEKYTEFLIRAENYELKREDFDM